VGKIPADIRPKRPCGEKECFGNLGRNSADDENIRREPGEMKSRKIIARPLPDSARIHGWNLVDRGPRDVE
jgi:hypothetical protein